MNNEIMNNCYKSLIESLELAAADYKNQVDSLPNFVIVTDEISTTFGEAFTLVNQLVEGGYVSQRANKLLIQLDNWLSETPNDDYLSTLDALENHFYWQQVRLLARKILIEIRNSPLRPSVL